MLFPQGRGCIASRSAAGRLYAPGVSPISQGGQHWGHVAELQPVPRGGYGPPWSHPVRCENTPGKKKIKFYIYY